MREVPFLEMQNRPVQDCDRAMKAAVGYIRVSTQDQNPDLQFDALHAAGLRDEYLFWDFESGTELRRDGYQTMISLIKEERLINKVVVWKMDRLGRDPKELLSFFWLCDELNVEVESLTETFVSNRTKTPGDFLIWWISVGLSVFELLTLKMRQRAGIASAKAAGKHLGRPRKNV